MDQLLREFLPEAEDLLEALFKDIEELREKYGEGRSRRELVGRIFRHVHTLKGTAAAAGLEATSQIAHEFESLLDGVRLGSVTVSASVLDGFEDAAHALSQTLGAAARSEASELPLPLLENLRLLTERADDERGSQRASTEIETLLPEDIARALSADEAQRLREARAEGQNLFLVNVTFDLETFDQRFRELSAALGQSGEVVSTLPGLTEAASGAISFRLLYACQGSVQELKDLASDYDGSASIEELPAAHRTKEATDGDSESEIPDDVSGTETIAPLTSQVRVELGKLDELISAAHELLTETKRTLDLALEGELGSSESPSATEARATAIHRRFLELEEQLIGLRRVPLEQTLERVARAGRQAARALGKEIFFEIVGGKVRLDKSLADAISDPLLHLVRNAVGHGIENPVERTGAGKSERGIVRLEAIADSDSVILKITDDGRGIDLESVARAASERGILESGQSVTKQQALRLIFRPGFSTASVVSKMSGRGVGLDVVERAVEQVGGEMRVWSEPGQGTTFEMIVPVALALLSTLVVTSAGYSYCVDARHISEGGQVSAADVKLAGQQELIGWRGARLPLLSLRQLLGQPSAQEQSAGSWPVIILSQAKKVLGTEASVDERERVAVQVDGWSEQRTEVLVRRLGAHGARWYGVSGAAKLQDGTLALVLDLPRLLEAYKAGC